MIDERIHPQLGFEAYMEVITNCDLCLNLYPFGHCNGIVDVLLNGVVRVYMQGTYLAESIARALYQRLGLPE